MSHPLHIAFIWHMHQPYYRDVATGACSMPWVRLHATKDYVDMIELLGRFPSIHQTFNLVPSLLDQVEAYLPPISASDVFLDLSRKSAAELSDQDQRFLLQWFFLANVERMIKPFPRYHDLLAKRGLRVPEEEWPNIQKRFRTQDYLDLQVLFNLVWIDPWLRHQDPRLAHLEAKGGRFTEEEKRLVLDHQLALLARVIPSYRDAAARGQIELTTSPYFHPIMPLLIDLRAAHEALPSLTLPETPFRHSEDARWQLQEALRRHQELFRAPPRGLWPPEGSVSEEFIRLAIGANIQWIAADETTLWHTLNTPRSAPLLYRPHRLRRKEGELAVVFRDRELSDLIGFVYSQWDHTIAATDFLKRLADIAQQCQDAPQPSLVTILLDGENAWESYPHDGHEFLTTLYRALASDERFRCVTVSEFLDRYPIDRSDSLPPLSSGSWIDGNFATWIGHPEKNDAWTHLANARFALAPYDRTNSQHTKAWRSLGAAEGSDWMWWFGDTHFSAQAEEFDRLFRSHLANCYRLTGQPVPATLNAPIRRPSLRILQEPTGLIHPIIDGRESSYYEWLYAGQIDLTQHYAATQRTGQCLQRLYYGADQTHQYVRVDLELSQLLRDPSWTIDFLLSHGVQIQVIPLASVDSPTSRPPGQGKTGPALEPPAVQIRLRPPSAGTIQCALKHILELAFPSSLCRLNAGEKLQLAIALTQHGEILERYPSQGWFELTVSGEELEATTWGLY